jgi:DNA-binding NtrC family response regulator
MPQAKGMPMESTNNLSSQPPRIVVVDDEPYALEAIRMLAKQTYTDVAWLTFDKPEEAMAELARADPDLFITDSAMPKMCAPEILKSLANRRVNYPVIVMTGGLPPDDEVLGAAGPDLKVRLITKPFTARVFFGLVEDCLPSLAQRRLS